MSAAIPSSSHQQARIIQLNVPRLVSHVSDASEACASLVRRLVSISEIDYAALWVRSALLGQAGTSFHLAAAEPGKIGAKDVIDSDDPLAAWANAHREFSWQVSDPSYASIQADSFMGRGLFVAFTLEGEIILKLHASDRVIGAPEEIRGVQRTIVDLLAYLKSTAPALPAHRENEDADGLLAIIDLAFLEATAMGDEEFMHHIMQISVEEIEGALARLDAARANDNRETMVFVVHKLRSTARTVGAEAFDAALNIAEASLADATPTEVQTMLAACEENAVRTIRALKTRL